MSSCSWEETTLILCLLLFCFIKSVHLTVRTGDPGIFELSPDEYDDPLQAVDQFWDGDNELEPAEPSANTQNVLIVGAGPVEFRPLVEKWVRSYASYREAFANVITDNTTYYDDSKPDDSSAAYVDYVITSRKPSAIRMSGENIQIAIPFMVGGVYVGYRVPDIKPDEHLYFTRDQLAGIFNGTLWRWDDVAFDSINNPWWNKSAGLLQTNKTIRVFISQWNSIVTRVLTRYLSKNLPSDPGFDNRTGWAKTVTDAINVSSVYVPIPPFGLPDELTPSDLLTYNLIKKNELSIIDFTFSSGWTKLFKQGDPNTLLHVNEGRSAMEIIGATLSTNYSICIVRSLESVISAIPFAGLQGQSGAFAAPGPVQLLKTVSDYYAAGKNDSTNPRADYTNLAGDAYPLTYMYYVVIKSGDGYLGNPIDCNRAVNLFRFLRFIYGTQSMRDYAMNFGTSFVPAAAYAEARSQLKQVKCGPDNDSVWLLMKQAIRAEQSVVSAGILSLILSIALPVPTIVLLGYVIWRFCRFVRMLQKIQDAVYKVSSSGIFLASRQYALTDRFKGVIASRRVVDYHTPKAYVHTMYFGRWRAHQVMLRPCSLNIHRMSQTIKKALVTMIEISSHERIATFYGLSEVRNGRYFVSNFCPYGDLRSIIIAKEYTFSLTMKYSLAGDIADGMDYLHKRKILHGNLRSCAVYIEADFSAKVGDWEYNTLHRLQGSYFPQETRLAQTLTLFEQTAFYPWLYWTAPEVLQCGMLGTAVKPCKNQDVYSFGIILGEIFGEEAAFQRYQDSPYNFTPTEIITKILSGNLRPRLTPGAEAPASVIHLMNHCWTFVPRERPNFPEIKRILRLVTSPRKPISDLVVIESQILADKLKKKAKRMESRYKEVAKNFHRYSRALVPFPIWRRVYIGHIRPPLSRHEDAVVLRCTLCDYDAMIAFNSPAIALETINLLHRVFADMIEANGRIYRIFQDGAAVVAVGGAPFGLELDPVHSVAQTALDYLVWANSSKAPHQPAIQMRFGIHSGAVAAGCVDYSAAHYVLLGELMKTAAHVEQASQPYRVLISDDFHDKLRQLAKVYVKYRVVDASVPIRGYEKKTYWLTGSNIYDQQYVLDDILYGKDELDKASDAEVIYGAEGGIVKDCHLNSIVPVDGKNIHGSGEPRLMDSAAIIRGLKKRKAAIMKVPPPHILKAQVIDHTGKKKLRAKEHHTVADFQTEHRRAEEEFGEEGATTPADLLVGIHNAQTERQKKKKKPWTFMDMMPSDIGIRLIDEDEVPQVSTRKVPLVASRPSVLSSVRTMDDNSIGSGEGRNQLALTFGTLENPPYAGVLGLGVTNRAQAKLEDVPKRPYSFRDAILTRRGATPTALTHPTIDTERKHRRSEAAEILLTEPLEEETEQNDTAEDNRDTELPPQDPDNAPVMEHEEGTTEVPSRLFQEEKSSDILPSVSLHGHVGLRNQDSSRCVSVFADLPSFNSDTATMDLMPSVRVGQDQSRYVDAHTLDQSDQDLNDEPSDDGLAFVASHESRAVDEDGRTAREPVTALEEQSSSASHQHFISHLTSGSPSVHLHLPTGDRSRLSPSQSQHSHRE